MLTVNEMMKLKKKVKPPLNKQVKNMGVSGIFFQEKQLVIPFLIKSS
jgi:hypothetical protein